MTESQPLLIMMFVRLFEKKIKRFLIKKLLDLWAMLPIIALIFEFLYLQNELKFSGYETVCNFQRLKEGK